MGTIKQDRKDLEMLLNGIAPSANSNIPGAAPVSSVQVPVQQPTNIIDNNKDGFEPEKLFEFDYDSIRKGTRKKCRKTILNIVNHILTEDLIKEEYVQDKIEQDIDILTDLYMQTEQNSLMQRSIVLSVARGNTIPRNYEVFAQLTDKLQSLNKQILNTEQIIRKTYIDLKFEIRDKEQEEAYEKNLGNKALPASQEKKQQGVLITSSKDLIEMAKKAHKDKFLENKINDISYTEIVENNNG